MLHLQEIKAGGRFYKRYFERNFCYAEILTNWRSNVIYSSHSNG